jgi:hypothetical protein
MPDYLNPTPPPVDPDGIAQATFDRIRESFPNYDPRDSQLATIVIVALSLRAAEVADLVPLIPKSIFRWFGANIVNLPPLAGTPASATVTVFVRDNLGYTVDADTVLAIEDADGATHLFGLDSDVIIPAGSTSSDPVTATALDDGADANNITGGTVTLIEALDYVLDITQLGTSSGGTDAEEDEAYLSRLTQRMGLAPRPVLADDFAALSMVEFAEIYRMAALDHYTPGTNQTTKLDLGGTITGGTYTVTVTPPGLSAQTTNPITWIAGDNHVAIQAALAALPAMSQPNDVTVTLQSGTPNDYLLTFGGRWAAQTVTVSVTSSLTGTAPTIAATTVQAAVAPNSANAGNISVGGIDADGNNLSTAVKTSLDTFLQANREWGFLVNVIDPTRNIVDAAFSFTTVAGYDSADVKARAEQAVKDYVSPLNFATPPNDARGWTLTTKVYLWEVIGILQSILGLDRLLTLSLGLNGGAQASGDLTLLGSIPITVPGAIVGTPV